MTCLVCGQPATNQYQKDDGHGNTTAAFTCTLHAYQATVPQATGRHTNACLVVPCTCTPLQAPTAPQGALSA